ASQPASRARATQGRVPVPARRAPLHGGRRRFAIVAGGPPPPAGIAAPPQPRRARVGVPAGAGRRRGIVADMTRAHRTGTGSRPTAAWCQSLRAATAGPPANVAHRALIVAPSRRVSTEDVRDDDRCPTTEEARGAGR